MELIIFLVLFAVLLIIGSPIWVSMIIPSVVYITMTPALNMMIASQKFLVGINSFPLMAVPFFVLAGNLMNGTSVTDRIFDFARVCVGHRRGGLGYVNVLSSVIFSGMSGSAIADVGGLGQVELKAMKDAGFPDDFSIGVTAASGCIGPIIPPSIPFVTFAAYASVSTGALFIGGIIPGIIMALALCVSCFVIAKKRDFPRDRKYSAKEKWEALKRSWLALLMPVIIIGGIWTGVCTATEAALIAIVYALVVGLFVYRDFNIKNLPKILLDSSKTVVPVMIVVMASTIFCWILTYNKLDKLVLNGLLALTDSRAVVLLVIMVTVFIMGMFFDGIVVTMLLVPMLVPICAAYNINIIHLGVAITFGKMIGMLTPPFGQTLFVLARSQEKPLMEIARYCYPWLIPLTIAWLLITYCEPLTMFLPNLLGFG